MRAWNQVIASVVALGAVLSSDAYAQGPAIAIVDMQKVISESVAGKAARNNVDEKVKKAQASIAQLKTELEREQGELQKQASVLSASALESRREAFEKKQRDFERRAQDLQESIRQTSDVEVGKIVTEIRQVVQELSSEKGYTFVFERDRQNIIYASERIDISQEVVQRLDKKKVSL
jgi:outer membrane protein